MRQILARAALGQHCGDAHVITAEGVEQVARKEVGEAEAVPGAKAGGGAANVDRLYAEGDGVQEAGGSTLALVADGGRVGQSVVAAGGGYSQLAPQPTT